MSNATKMTNDNGQDLATFMRTCTREFDAMKRAEQRRPVSFRSAQQRTQSAQGIARALKIGLGAAVLVVALVVVL